MNLKEFLFYPLPWELVVGVQLGIVAIIGLILYDKMQSMIKEIKEHE